MNMASAAQPSFVPDMSNLMVNQKRVTSTKQPVGPSPSLHGAMSITKSKRTSNIAMSAGFGPSGARLTDSRKNAEPEFTITHMDDVNEKPWGFPR